MSSLAASAELRRSICGGYFRESECIHYHRHPAVAGSGIERKHLHIEFTQQAVDCLVYLDLKALAHRAHSIE